MRVPGIALLGVLLWSAGALAAEGEVVTKPSQYSVAETVARLESVLKASGMTVFARIDHAAEAEKAGLQMRPAQLVIFGNPKGGTPLMRAAPTVALDLPLKALAWEDAQGRVWLSYTPVSILKSRHAIGGQDELIKGLDGALTTLTGKALE
jgi:uncharacterized protein (DUF302 family)